MAQQPRKITPQEIAKIIEFLELLSNPVMNRFANQPHPKDLPQMKKIVRRQMRVLAKKYHPDLNGNNEEMMKRINEACDAMLDLQYRPKQSKIVVHVYTTGTADCTSSATTMFW